MKIKLFLATAFVLSLSLASFAQEKKDSTDTPDKAKTECPQKDSSKAEPAKAPAEKAK